MEVSYNSRCPAVKRLLREAQELHEASEEYFAQPLEDNLFEWHFTFRGPPDTEFDGGIYHGRIIMPSEYPMKPPNIIFFTPNGRFETNQKICLSISGHHPESWQPSWSIRTALLALIGFMPSPASGTIGALDYTAAERKTLAKRSEEFECTTCGRVKSLLKERTGDNKDIQREAREASAQMVVTANRIDTEDISVDETISTEDEKQQSPPDGDATSSNDDTRVLSSETSVTASSNPSSPIFNATQSAAAQISPPSPVTTTANSSNYLSLVTNNFILSAAVMLLVALVLRRFFLLESDIIDDVI